VTHFCNHCEDFENPVTPTSGISVPYPLIAGVCIEVHLHHECAVDWSKDFNIPKYSYVGVLEALGMFRGLQLRVAKKVGVDATFVSRVARGERSSDEVMAALMEELDSIRDYLNRMREH
jgi:hypothetical protein